MTVTIKRKSQSCSKDILTEYIRIGLQIECPHCLCDTVPQIPNGTLMPGTGSEIEYRDFRQLISEKAYRKEIINFIKVNFGYTIKDRAHDSLILNDRKEAIDPIWLHLQIQESRDLRNQLYQLAMSLWR